MNKIFKLSNLIIKNEFFLQERFIEKQDKLRLQISGRNYIKCLMTFNLLKKKYI